VLLDPATGAPVLAGPELVRMLGGEPGVGPELMRFQVETATGVCTSLDQAGRELVRLRRLAADAAAQLGCRLVASGVAPYHAPGLAAVTPLPRYRELARRYGPVVAQAGTCACHVHVGVPSRDLGVQVLARLRPWLAPLLAVTANSPIAAGRDTGWASWRHVLQSRWPTAAPPGAWPDAAAYDTEIRRHTERGAALLTHSPACGGISPARACTRLRKLTGAAPRGVGVTVVISSPLWGVSHVALRAFELRGGRVILSGVYDATEAMSRTASLPAPLVSRVSR